jgi:hypothetical protein
MGNVVQFVRFFKVIARANQNLWPQNDFGKAARSRTLEHGAFRVVSVNHDDDPSCCAEVEVPEFVTC